MNEKETINKGTEVTVKKYGVGVVETISQQDSDNGAYAVYHVRFANGEVRHFTGTELKVAK